MVRAGRARWKIENEAFNTLKNQGYHLKHNFGHGDRHLSEAFFVLNLLASTRSLAGRWPVSARAHLLQFPPRVLGRGALRLPACLTSGMPRTRHAPARGRPSTPATKVRAGWLPPPASPAGSRGMSGDRHPWRRPWPHGWHATQEVVGSEPVGCSGGASGTRRTKSTARAVYGRGPGRSARSGAWHRSVCPSSDTADRVGGRRYRWRSSSRAA